MSAFSSWRNTRRETWGRRRGRSFLGATRRGFTRCGSGKKAVSRRLERSERIPHAEPAGCERRRTSNAEAQRGGMGGLNSKAQRLEGGRARAIARKNAKFRNLGQHSVGLRRIFSL